MKRMKRIFAVGLLCSLLLSGTAYASDSYQEITDEMYAFGLGDYIAYKNMDDLKFHIFSVNHGEVTEFLTADSALPDRDALSLSDVDTGDYFAAILDGKYAVFTHAFKQLTPNKYTWITFRGDFAIGEIADPMVSPNDNSQTTYELIELASGKVFLSVTGSRIRISDDGQYFITDKGIYNNTGQLLFQPEAARIFSEDVIPLSDAEFLWIGETNQQYALFQSNTQKSEWYDEIDPVFMLWTQLFTASKDGTSFLLDSTGKIVTETDGSISLLATDVAAITENNTVTYWNHNGEIDFLNSYSAVQALSGDSPARMTNLLVQNASDHKWGVIRQDGTELLPAIYDLAENVTQSNDIYRTVLNGTSQVWNLSAGKPLPIPYHDGLQSSTYVGDKAAEWIASLKELENGIAIADLYDTDGNLVYENVRQIFYLNGQKFYAKAVSTEKNNYQEVLETEDGRRLFSAPLNEIISLVSRAVIRTTPCTEEYGENARCFLDTSFQSAEPQFSYIRYYLLHLGIKGWVLCGGIVLVAAASGIIIHRKHAEKRAVK